GLSQENHRLTGGIASAHDNDFFTATQLRLNKCGAVIDSGAFEAGQVFERKSPVPCAGCYDYRSSGKAGPIVEFNSVWLSLACQPGCASGDDNLSAELLGLGVGPAG